MDPSPPPQSVSPKNTCPACGGRGSTPRPLGKSGGETIESCHLCNGSGRRPKKRKKSKVSPAAADPPFTAADRKAANDLAGRIWLLWWGCVMGLCFLEMALLPHSFPFLPVFGIAIPIALMAFGVAVSRHLEAILGSPVVLSWRRWVRYACFVVWLSGIITTHSMNGQEGNWREQHDAYLRAWVSDVLTSHDGETWPRLVEWLGDALSHVEVGFCFLGVPIVLFWLSRFWAGYRNAEKESVA